LKNRILINGLGRVGKAILRIALKDKSLNIVAINELNSNLENIAYSINYDSTYGRLNDKFYVSNNYIQNTDTKIQILNYQKLEDINFKDLNIDIVVDASGSNYDLLKLKTLSPRLFFITHPEKNADINIMFGINEHLYKVNKYKIISTSSCSATAMLPVFKLIYDNYRVISADITTIHPLLSHQKTLDCQCVGSYSRNIECSFEFGRSSVQNIIPSKTTTIEAARLVSPCAKNTPISSSSFRVPTNIVGALNMVLHIKKRTTREKLIELCKKYEKNQSSHIIKNSFEPLVSEDFKAMEFSSIIDHRFTEVINHNMIKLVVWYDNEWGYSSRVVEMIKYIKDLKDSKIG